MSLIISENERKLLLNLKGGVSEINIYKFYDYVSVVTFSLINGSLVTVRAHDEYIAPRFEVFPISVTNTKINSEPDKIIKSSGLSDVKEILILSKFEWSVPTTEPDKKKLLGDPEGSTTQYEGLASEIPDNSINSIGYDAGIQIIFKKEKPFFVVSSINPFDLAVSDEISFEELRPEIYEYAKLC